jgi:hypothetical protein
MADTKPVKAELRELKANGQENPSVRVPVQFNPETLKVSFANQVVPPDNANTDKSNTSALQFLSKGSTKLSVQLWFDVTATLPQGQQGVTDVRKMTEKVAYFMKPKPSDKDPKQIVPPGVRFVWGTFQFDGLMESLEESLEFFSPDGRPLRASLSISLTQQSIQFAFAKPDTSSGKGPSPGTKPLTPAPAGSSLQGLAAGLGKATDWQSIAQANGIENPRLLKPGQLIDMNASVSVSGSVSASVNLGF